VGDGVGHLSAGCVRDLKLNLEWYLPLNSVGYFSGNFICLKTVDFVGLGDVVSSGDLVWDGSGVYLWDLLGN
jgi:hypothetical protein